MQGLVWPAAGGGALGQTAAIEVFTKPTLQNYLTDIVTGGRVPHPFGSDTKARPAAPGFCSWQARWPARPWQPGRHSHTRTPVKTSNAFEENCPPQPLSRPRGLVRAQAVVASFRAPAPPTQAAFFFHATEELNPCMWATDFDISQVDYQPFPGQPACPGCKVRAYACPDSQGARLCIWV